MSSSKGQIYSMDFVFGVVVFLFVLVLFILLANTTFNRLSYFEEERWRDEAARVAVEQLIESPGYPSHWEQISVLRESNLRSLGLAEERNVISKPKLDRFITESSSNYSFFKRVLGLGRYNTQVLFESLDGTELYEFNEDPPTDQTLSTVSRLAIFDDQIVVVRIYVW